jgi:hypothetical protein
MQDARGTISWRSEGKQNAFKHGRYTADAIARRRGISKLLAAMKGLTQQIIE